MKRRCNRKCNHGSSGANEIRQDDHMVEELVSAAEGRHCEKVHGRDDLSVVVQEGGSEFAAVLGRRQAPEIARDGGESVEEVLIFPKDIVPSMDSTFCMVILQAKVALHTFPRFMLLPIAFFFLGNQEE